MNPKTFQQQLTLSQQRNDMMKTVMTIQITGFASLVILLTVIAIFAYKTLKLTRKGIN